MTFFGALQPTAWLFAAKDEIIPALIAIAVALFSVLVHWIRNMGRQPPGQQGPANAPRPPNPVDQEIGDFLRRAAQQRGAQPAGQQGGGPQPQPAPRPQRRPASPRRPAPAADAPVQAEVVGERPVGGAVEKHVRQHLDADEFRRRSEQLGAEVAQADDKVEGRLRQKFDHRVSRLTGRPGEAAATPAEPSAAAVAPGELPVTAAAGLAALFATADSIRHAIIINEILRRPEERW